MEGYNFLSIPAWKFTCAQFKNKNMGLWNYIESMCNYIVIHFHYSRIYNEEKGHPIVWAYYHYG